MRGLPPQAPRYGLDVLIRALSFNVNTSTSSPVKDRSMGSDRQYPRRNHLGQGLPAISELIRTPCRSVYAIGGSC